ncbi:MAG TPA: hypothetical protein ENI72_01070 [Rhodospirillales bacterium]|nr:hypothetical protein [Rhodospirillales bacterium]
MIDHQTALIYTMVFMSAADTDMTDAELRMIGEAIGTLPVFKGYDMENLTATAADCAEVLNRQDGLDEAFDEIEAVLPKKLRETAYALACDIAAADGDVHQEELRLLEMIRHRLDIDRLTAAAIERGARAHFATV